LHMAQLMPLPLTVSRLVIPFWYRLTWVVTDKGPLNGCMCVFVLLEILHKHYTMPKHTLDAKTAPLLLTQSVIFDFVSSSKASVE